MMTSKLVKVSMWFTVQQEFVMPQGIYESMKAPDWYEMFSKSVTDGEVTDWDIIEVEDVEEESEDDDRDR